MERSIKSIISSLNAKLIDLGYYELAQDASLSSEIENSIRTRLAPAPIAQNQTGASTPDLSPINKDLDEVAGLLKREKDDRCQAGYHCSVFLGAASHSAPPPYPRSDGSNQSEYENGPLGAGDLSMALSSECDFVENFPDENPWNLMRVSTWFEKDPRNGLGRRGLEDRIMRDVEDGKSGSEMIRKIASWPCRTFFTTNYDTHLEKALLEHHPEVFVWIYRPTALSVAGTPGGKNSYDLRTHWWRMTKVIPDPTTPDSPVRYETNFWKPPGAQYPSSATQAGISPGEPPADAVVVCKLHGDFRQRGSIVVTDEDYIKFLCRFSKSKLPNRLLLPLRSAIMFVGYSLRDYNMRYVLTSLREEIDDAWNDPPVSYSVDLRPDPILKATWQRENRLFFIEHNLWDIVPAISDRLTP